MLAQMSYCYFKMNPNSIFLDFCTIVELGSGRVGVFGSLALATRLWRLDSGTSCRIPPACGAVI
jgi:hypothetical protein